MQKVAPFCYRSVLDFENENVPRDIAHLYSTGKLGRQCMHAASIIYRLAISSAFSDEDVQSIMMQEQVGNDSAHMYQHS